MAQLPHGVRQAFLASCCENGSRPVLQKAMALVKQAGNPVVNQPPSCRFELLLACPIGGPWGDFAAQRRGKGIIEGTGIEHCSSQSISGR